MSIETSCFFFSSRRRHTRLQGDWSSDVCSSDLRQPRDEGALGFEVTRNHRIVNPDYARQILEGWGLVDTPHISHFCNNVERSEERRVGKECRSRWSPYH